MDGRIDLVLSYESDTPIYMQLYEQVSAQILKDCIKPHAPLPSIRTIAKELRISIIPVKRAWEELERNGFIYTIAGKGCFVSPHTSVELTQKRDNMAAEKIRDDIAYCKSVGMTLDEILELAKTAYNSK